jgi:hydroxyacyl-ACP dehydratase HTD2-like protein with hotdog domain
VNVGQTPGESVPQRFLVTRQDIAKFSTAIGYPMPPGADAPVPVMFYLTMGMARGRILTREQLGADGLPAEETALGGRFMAAGTEVWFHEDLAVGEVVTVRQKILADTRKTGRQGDFRLVTVQREYLGENGRLVIDERYTRVVR